MSRKRPAHVSYYRDRHGVIRWRFRKRGLPESQTRELFGSEAWWTWYHAASAGEPRQIGAERTVPGSLSALAVAYYSSADWKMLAPTTQATYRGIIDRFRAEHGDKPIARLEAANVRRFLDAKADTPAAANNLLKVLRVLMRYAVDRGMRHTDPTAGVKPLRYKTDGFHTWTEDEIAAFEKRWPVGTRERLAFDLLLYTAQRSGDVRRMGRQHVKDGHVTVRQEKTGATLEIPLHERLKASLAACPADNLTFIVTQHGKPYTPAGFGNMMRDAARKAGLTGTPAHGLRKAAATRLADAGCSHHEIMAVTGHKTFKEVARYTVARDQRALAGAAMAKAGKTETERNLSNHSDQLDKTGVK